MYTAITEADFRKNIKNGIAEGSPRIFLFYGEEDYLKHNDVALVRDTFLSPDSVAFDYVGIGSAAYSAEALSSAVASPPMFGTDKVVSVSVSPDDLRPSELTDLCDILAAPETSESNIIIINVPDGGMDPGYPKKPSPVLKKFAEFAQPVLFDRIAPNRLSGWVGKHYQASGVTAAPDVCAYTVDYCGTDMFRLASETDKIAYFVLAAGRTQVQKEDVKTAGCPSVEFDTFALANAMMSGRYRAALEVLGFLKSQKTEPTRIMADIIRVICDMSALNVCRKSGMTREQMSAQTGIKPYPLGRYLQALDNVSDESLKRALALAGDTDEKIKGYGADYVAIEQLICSM